MEVTKLITFEHLEDRTRMQWLCVCPFLLLAWQSVLYASASPLYHAHKDKLKDLLSNWIISSETLLQTLGKWRGYQAELDKARCCQHRRKQPRRMKTEGWISGSLQNMPRALTVWLQACSISPVKMPDCGWGFGSVVESLPSKRKVLGLVLNSEGGVGGLM